MPKTAANPLDLPAGVFVGEDARKEGIVMRRINIRCQFRLPDREFDANTPVEEIPLMRVLYSYYGGKVNVLSGPLHKVFNPYVVQDLTHYQLENIAGRYRRNYNGIVIRKAQVNIFDQVYGEGADCSFIDKMRKIVEMFDVSLLDKAEGVPDVQHRQQVAAHVEAILANLFPHVSPAILSRGERAVIGLDAVGEPPKPGASPLVDTDAPPPATPTLDVPKEMLEPKGNETPEPNEPVTMMGDLAPDTDLVAFLASKGLDHGQAYSLAELLLAKPPGEWTSEDYEGIPDLTKRNHARITRLIGEFYNDDTQDQDGAEEQEDVGGIPLD